MDWVRLFFLLPAIIVSHVCFFAYGMVILDSARDQDPFRLFTFLLPIPLCITYIGVLCKSRVELLLASLLAMSHWLLLILYWLISFKWTDSPHDRLRALFYGAHILLIGGCAVGALLGQQIRRFLLTRLSNSQPTSTPFAP
jgi:hypothetical protein